MLHHQHRVRPLRQRSSCHDPNRLPAAHRAHTRLRPVARLHLADHLKPRRNLRHVRRPHCISIASSSSKRRKVTVRQNPLRPKTPAPSPRPSPASRSTVSTSSGDTPAANCSTRCRASSKLNTRADLASEDEEWVGKDMQESYAAMFEPGDVAGGVEKRELPFLGTANWELPYRASSCPSTVALLANPRPVSRSTRPERTSFAISPSKCCMPSFSLDLIASSSVRPGRSPCSTHSRVRELDFKISTTATRSPPSARGISLCAMM